MKESQTESARWSAVAAAWSVPIPEERLRAIEPALDRLAQFSRAARDRDLAGLEPVFVFRPLAPESGE